MKKELIAFQVGPVKNRHKTITLEEVKFIKPDIAIEIIRQVSKVGDAGMFVASKESSKWLVVSLSNVSYKLA